MCVYEGLEIANAIITAYRTVDVYQESKAIRLQNEMEAEAFMKEAKIAKDQAAVERQEGLEESRRQKLLSILDMQKEKAFFASNNIMTTSETALNVMESEKLNGELMALNTLKEAEKNSDKYLAMANDYYEKASLSTFNAKQTKRTMFKELGKEAFSFASSLVG